MSSLDPERVRALLAEYVRREIDEHRRAWEATGPARDPDGERLDVTGELLSDLATAWKDQDLSTVRRQVDEFISAHGLAVERGSPEYRELARSMLKAEMQVLDAVRSYQRGDFVPDSPVPVPAVSTPPRKPTPLLSAAIGECLEDRTVRQEIGQKTRSKDEAVLRLFAWIVGDKPLGEITADDMIRFRSVLPQLPTQMGKHKRFAGLSVDEVLSMPDIEPASASTNENRMARVQAFWTWAKRRRYVEDDFADMFKSKGVRGRSYSTFDASDLAALFLSEVYLEGKFANPWQYWVPLLGAYTGARLGELVQLHTSDILQVDGVWILRIDDEPAEPTAPKVLKNASSRRVVPLHPVLLERGLVEFAQGEKDAGRIRLFSDLDLKTRSADYASKRLNAYLRRCGIGGQRSRDKVFHSLRHTFVDHLRQRGVSDDFISALVGHESRGQTSRYGKRPGIEVLAPIVDKVDYPFDVGRVQPFRFDPTKPRRGRPRRDSQGS